MYRRLRRSFLVLIITSTHLLPAQRFAVHSAPLSSGDNSIILPGVAPGSTPDLSGYISVPYPSGLNFSGGEMTIEAWVKRDDASRYETIVGNGYKTSYWLGFAGGKVRFYPHGESSFAESSSSVPSGVWTHIAASYDGITARVYINGILDGTDTLHPGPLVPAAGLTALGIGADLVNSFYQNYFSGRIDEVRIWRIRRTIMEIRAGMFVSYGSYQPYMRAEWPLNGDANDAAGYYHGTLVGTNYHFTVDGAIPHDIRVPQVSTSPSLEGVCSEYGTSAQIMVGAATVYLMHTATDLWVCFEGLTAPGSVPDNWSAVYLDTTRTRTDLAQPEHLSLEVHSNLTRRTRQGNGTGDYTMTTSYDSQWDGVYRLKTFNRSAEFRISSSLVGGWSKVIGLSLAQHWITVIGDDRNWPARAIYNSPRTWSSATLGGLSAGYTFAGEVTYLPKASSLSATGVGGAGVNLIGVDAATGTEAVVAFARSDMFGNFSLYSNDDYPTHRLELDPYTLPKGLIPYRAIAPAPAESLDSRSLDYGTSGSGSYYDNNFVLADAKPFPLDFNGPYYLIVSPQSVIDSGALDDFVTFKRWLGFEVETKSLEAIASEYSGYDIGMKVRAFEHNQLAVYGNRFKYVLLVGHHSVIPMRFIKFYSKSAVDCDKDTGVYKAEWEWPHTDWYYADLNSPWDRDAFMNCWGDGIWSDPKDRAPGYSPNTALTFTPTVSVGRLPFTNPVAIRTALKNSILFESQSNDFKRNALLALSLMSMKSQVWKPGKGAYEPSGATTDGSYLGYAMRTGYLDANLFSTTVFYENEHPPTGYSYAHYFSPSPLTEANVLAAMKAQAYGFISMQGHSSRTTVSRTGWMIDANLDGILQQPTEPLGSPPTSYEEAGTPPMFSLASMMSVPARNGEGAIYLLGGCMTGQYDSADTLGSWLLAAGRGVAWIGATSYSVYTTGWKEPAHGNVETFVYLTGLKMLDSDLRLGEALWQTMSERLKVGHDLNALVFDLYGDPSLSYWGNPGGDATLAAWPMLRQNALGQSRSSLSGPVVPKVLWSYPGSPPGTGTLPPSPVASNRGEVIVAHGSYVDVLVGGSLEQRLALDAAAFGTPAIAADGTVYALDTSGRLYAFAPKPESLCGLLCRERYRRWTFDLGGAPLTSPVIGSDGFIAVAFIMSGEPMVSLIRPDGYRPARFTQVVHGNPIGALAVDGNRSVYATTTSGNIYKIDFFCTDTSPCVVQKTSGPYVTPPLLAYGAVYTGQSDQKVVKRSLSLGTILGSYTVDSAISAGPVAGPGGQILVGTVGGKLISLNADLSLRWQRNIGASVSSVPAYSSDALYVVSQGKLQAFSIAGGSPLWSIFVDFYTASGSPAVGYGREIYMQNNTGKVVAVGEGWGVKPTLLVGHEELINGVVGGIRLDWTSIASQPPPGFNGYRLERRMADGLWEEIAELGPSTTTYEDATVLPGVDYEYRIQAMFNQGEDSDYTQTRQSIHSLPQAPQPPILARANAESSEGIGLAWSDTQNSQVAAYLIERSDNPNGPFNSIFTTSSETRVFTDTQLLPGTPYYYQVSALNAFGAGLPSNILGATTFQRSLPSPENVKAMLGADGQVQVSWANMPQGVTAIIEGQLIGQTDFFFIGATTQPGLYIFPLDLPNSYLFRVKFVFGETESAYSTAEDRLVIGDFSLTSIFLPFIRR